MFHNITVVFWANKCSLDEHKSLLYKTHPKYLNGSIYQHHTNGCLSHQAFLGSVGPCCRWLTCISSHVRGGNLQQLGPATPAVPWTHSAPADPGCIGTQSADFAHTPRFESLQRHSQSEHRDSTASLRRGPITLQRHWEQQWRTGFAKCTFCW